MYSKGIIMILSLFYCILLLTLLCHKVGIAKNHALFGVKFVSLHLDGVKKMTFSKSGAVCSMKCAVCSLQCAVCSVQFAVCSLQCVVCSAVDCRVL